jgi:hypothetical protein
MTDGGIGGGSELLRRELGTSIDDGGTADGLGSIDAGTADTDGTTSGKLLGGFGSLSMEEGTPVEIDTGALGASIELVVVDSGATGRAPAVRCSRGRRGIPELPQSTCHSR